MILHASELLDPAGRPLRIYRTGMYGGDVYPPFGMKKEESI